MLLSAQGLRASCAEQADVAKPGVVEYITGKPKRSDSLGTTSYEPSEKERPFFKRLAKGELATGGLAGDYDIAKKDKTYVGWFGVVREIKEDNEKDQTVLLVEHKYFDGLTDIHILAVSFNGSGDFQAVVPGVGHKVRPLALVKVYGVVTGPTGESLPQVKAEFVRHWDWGTFTFLMASGTQRGSEKWRKLNRVNLDDIYEPYPSDGYYEKRLGKR
jgi:hypothetical protein